MSTYDVKVSHEDGYWVAVVAGVRGGATEARTLDRLRTEVIDLLVGLLDVRQDDVELRWDYGSALGETATRLATLKTIRQEMQRTQSEYEQTLRAVVRDLNAQHVSRRDAAALVEVSHQRVQQLVQT